MRVRTIALRSSETKAISAATKESNPSDGIGHNSEPHECGSLSCDRCCITAFPNLLPPPLLLAGFRCAGVQIHFSTNFLKVPAREPRQVLSFMLLSCR